MPNYIRANFKGGLYFFTVVTFERSPFLTTDLARKVLRQACKEVLNSYPFTVEAICLLPDHIHCIWRLPEGDHDFAKRWNSIKAKFTKQYLADWRYGGSKK